MKFYILVGKIRVIEAGIVLNGIDIVHLENEEYKINKNSDLRAALLHSILLILEEIGEQQIYHFRMKTSLLLAFTRKFKESDLIFYVILKPTIFDQASFQEMTEDMIGEFKFRFSNLYNKFCELFDDQLRPDISTYWKILPHLANLLMIRMQNDYHNELESTHEYHEIEAPRIPLSTTSPV